MGPHNKWVDLWITILFISLYIFACLLEHEKAAMERTLVNLEKGSICCSWNYCGQRLATGSIDGTLSIYDSIDPTTPSSFQRLTYSWKVSFSLPWIVLLVPDSIFLVHKINGVVEIWKLNIPISSKVFFFFFLIKGLFGSREMAGNGVKWDEITWFWFI